MIPKPPRGGSTARELPVSYMDGRYRWLSWVGWTLIGITCALTLLASMGLRNDHADAYEYLRMSQRLSAGGAPVNRGRPPLLPLVQAPLWHLGSTHAAWVGAHALQTAWVLLAGMLCLLVFRNWVGPLAGGGTALLCLDRVFIHFAPSALTDHLALAGTLCINLMWCRLVTRRNTAVAAAAGLVAGVLTQAKYILALIPLSLLVAGSGARGWRIRIPYAAGVVSGMVLVRVLVEGLSGQSPGGTLTALIEAYSQGAAGAYVGQFDWGKILLPIRFLVVTASPGIVVAGVIGAWSASKGRTALLVQLATVLATLCFVLGEKEARYLLPVLPVVYAFAALGLSSLWRVGCRHGGRLLGSILLAAFLVQPVAGAIREWGDHVRKEVNRYPAEGVADHIREVLRPESNLFWRGGAYALYRSQRTRMPGDDYYGVMRLGPGGVAFWLGRQCSIEHRAVPLLEGPLEERRAQAFAAAHRDGDVLVVAPPRGTEGGTLRLVSLAIRQLDPETVTPGSARSVGSSGPLHRGQIGTGFVLAYCRGALRAASLDDRETPLCEDAGMLGPVTVVDMAVTQLIP